MTYVEDHPESPTLSLFCPVLLRYLDSSDIPASAMKNRDPILRAIWALRGLSTFGELVDSEDIQQLVGFLDQP